MSSCSHTDAISRSGKVNAFGKAIASWTGRKARWSSGPRSTRPINLAMTADKAVVKPPDTSSGHASRKAAGFKVPPVLEITSAGRNN